MRSLKATLIVLGLSTMLPVWPVSQAQAAGEATGKIMTVLGPIDPAQVGHALMHEHLFSDFTLPDMEPERWKRAGRKRLIGATDVALYNAPLTMDNLGVVALGAYNRDNWQLDDEATAIAEMQDFKRHGGSTLVDVTSIGLKRNPRGLQRVARTTGVNIVMGTSWYSSGWWPDGIEQQSVESLTNQIVRDVTIGVDGTDAHAGIIGEIGASGDPGDAVENRILRASARASRLTGAAVTVALGSSKQHAKILDILASEGVDLHRVVLGHSDYLAGQVEYLKSLLDRGATIQFDLLGRPPLVTRTWPIDSAVARTIVDLIQAGYAGQLLLSQDISARTSLEAYGGTGYSYIEQSFLPYLKRQGVTDAQIATIVEANPRRLLTLVAPDRAAPKTMKRGKRS